MAHQTPDAPRPTSIDQGQLIGTPADATAEVFPSRAFTQAVADVDTALRGGSCCLLVTGVSGVGKTTLCRALGASGDDRTFVTATLDARMTCEHVLAQLLRDFGLLADPPPGAHYEKEPLLSAARRFLASLKPLSAHAVVVVDDAERLGAEVLTALHELSRSVEPAGQLLRLVLVGQPSLEARLREPDLQALQTSVRGHVRLQPLDRDEILPYVAHRAETIPGTISIAALTPDRVASVYEQSEGIPSRVNFFVARAAQSSADPGDTLLSRSEDLDETARQDSEIGAPVPASRRLPVLVAALVIVAGAGLWWTTRQQGPSDRRGSSPDRPGPAAAAQSDGQLDKTMPAPSGPAGGEATAPPAQAPVGPPNAASQTGASAAGPAGSADVGQYTVIVASFRTAARADVVAGQLQERQPPIAAKIERVGSWHQVVVGPVPTLEAARDLQRDLMAAGFPGTQVTLPPAPGPVEPQTR